MQDSSPRMALRLLDPPTPGALRAFCGRCGEAPPPRTRATGARESRVCGHCGLGLVLRTPLSVSRDSPFLIVDRALTVSAMSARAEELIGSDEQSTLGLPVERLLPPADEPELFKAVLGDAVLGGVSPQGLRCHLADGHGEPLLIRAGPCGPPPGALLLLAPTSF